MDERLKKELDELTVDYPSEEEIEQTLSYLHDQAPDKSSRFEKLYNQWTDILSLSTREIFYISPVFWVLNLFFLLLGVINVTVNQATPYLTLLAFAPLPVVTGVLEVLRSKDHNLLELEATTKFSWESLIYAKLLIISVFHLVLNVFFMGWIYFILQIDLLFSELLKYWAMPTLVFAVIGLFTTLHFSRKTSSVVLTSFWIGILYTFRDPDSYRYVFHQLGDGAAMTITLACIVILVLQMRQLTKKGKFFESIYS